MPESIFGCPSRHLLPPQSLNDTSGMATSEGSSQAAPVLPTRPRFEDVRFGTIGKQPELLGRISLLDPATGPYGLSSPPSPSPPPELSTNDIKPSSSRPTLLQQLAGTDNVNDPAASEAMVVQTSNGTLASRIQSNHNMPSHSANAADLPLSRPRLNRGRYTTIAVSDATSSSSLIPPIEVLPSAAESKEILASHRAGESQKATSSLPFFGPTTVAAGTASLESSDPSFSQCQQSNNLQLESSAGTSNMVQSTSRVPTPNLSVSSSVPTTGCASSLPPAVASGLSIPQSATEPVGTATDSGQRGQYSLASRHARLQAISDNLTSLASHSFSRASSSSPPGPSIPQARDDVARQEPLQQGEGDSIVLPHAYPVQHQPHNSRVDHVTNLADNVNTLVLAPTFTREFQTQTQNILDAVHNLSTTFGAAYRAHIEAENALAQQHRALDHQRALFAEQRRADEAVFQARLREFEQKEEELRVKEAAIFALENEAKAKEEARCALDATRRAQEEAERAEEEARRQEVQQQIAMALKELEELQALRSDGRLGNAMYASANLLGPPAMEQGDLPTEVEPDMSAEEVNAIRQRNDILAATERIRRMHEQRMQALQESTTTLRRLQDERKKLAEERERCRVADQERQRAAAEGADQVMRAAETGKELEENMVQPTPRPAGQDPLPASEQLDADTQVLAERSELGLGQECQQEEFGMEHAGGLAQKRLVNPENITSADPQRTASHPAKKVVSVPISGGVMLSTSQQSGNNHPHLPKPPRVKQQLTPSGVALGSQNGSLIAKPPSFVSASTEAGRKVTTDAPLFSIQLASEVYGAGAANTNGNANELSLPHSPPSQKQAFTPNPKSQTVLDSADGGGRELDLGPLTSVSPAQRSVNLRHLKKSRGRVEENEGGDRSVRRCSVKHEESTPVSLKTEEGEERSLPRDIEPASKLGRKEKSRSPVSLPRRPVIPPPRPRISMKSAATVSHDRTRHELPFTGQTELSSSQPGPGPAHLPRASPSPWVMDASAEQQEWAPALVDSIEPIPQSPQESASHPVRPYAGALAESTTQSFDVRDNQGLASSPSARPASPERESVALASRGPDEGRLRPSDENHKKRNRSGTRRQTDHYSPSPPHAVQSFVPSPPPSYRQSGDSWRPSSDSDIARTQSIRPPSPLAGRKRPHDRNWEVPHHTRRPDPWRRTPPPEHPSADRPYLHDGQKVVYERPPTPPASSTVPPSSSHFTSTRRQDSYRRPQEEAPRLQRHEPFERSHVATFGQPSQYDHGEDKEDAQNHPALLARMSDNPPRNYGGRGRGIPGRNKGDSGRGRGDLRNREAMSKSARVGSHLIGRISKGPATLQDRLEDSTW